MKTKAKLKAKVTPTSTCTWGDSGTVLTRDFRVAIAGSASAEVRVDSHRGVEVRMFGKLLACDEYSEIDAIIEVLKTAKKFRKLKVDSEAAIAKLVEEKP